MPKGLCPYAPVVRRQLVDLVRPGRTTASPLGCILRLCRSSPQLSRAEKRAGYDGPIAEVLRRRCRPLYDSEREHEEKQGRANRSICLEPDARRSAARSVSNCALAEAGAKMAHE